MPQRKEASIIKKTHELFVFIRIHALGLILLLSGFFLTPVSLSGVNTDTISPEIRAFSTGETTGHIADIYISNFSGKATKLHIRPYFIPSINSFQSYLTLTDTTLHLPDSTRIRIALKGYCADIFTDPVPEGSLFPVFSDWLEIDTLNGESNLHPSESYSWIKDNKSRIFFPNSKKYLGYSIDMSLYPAQVSWLLWITLQNLEKTYQSAISENKINTPYSADREKEKWAVIQHSFWIFTSELNGKYYPKDFFESKIRTQYSQYKNSTIPENDRINKGISQFWYVFHYLLKESETLDIFKINTRFVKNPDAEILIIQEKHVKH